MWLVWLVVIGVVVVVPAANVVSGIVEVVADAVMATMASCWTFVPSPVLIIHAYFNLTDRIRDCLLNILLFQQFNGLIVQLFLVYS